MGIEKDIDKDIDKELLKKVDAVSKGSRILTFITLPGLFILIAFGTVQINSQHQKIDSLSTVRKGLEQNVTDLDKQVKDLESKKVSLQAELMNRYGLSIDTSKAQSSEDLSLLTRSVAADQSLKSTLMDSAGVTKGITVKYYDRTIQEKRIAFELESLGYKFVPGTPQPQNEQRKTNAIWFGRGVPLNDIKIVSLAFIRAGIPIQGIQPFKKSLADENYKKYEIEVGTSIYIDNRPVYAADMVQNATAFERLSN